MKSRTSTKAHLTEGSTFDAEAILRQSGLRVTNPRLKVLTVLLSAGEPLDIQSIIERALPVRLDFSTVFRTVQHLDNSGVIRRVHLRRRTAHYETGLGGAHHDHVTCTVCKRVQPLPGGCPMIDYQKVLEEKTGFTMINHSLEFFGICPICQKNMQTKKKPHSEVRTPPSLPRFKSSKKSTIR